MSKKRAAPPVCVVLGAGLAGLGAAWQLQAGGAICHVYEKEPEVGGLSRSKRVGGFIFDIDGHLFHFRRQESFRLINGLLKKRLVRHQRSAWVYSHGRFIGYPFQANLSELPADVREECLAGFVKARRSGPVDPDGNFLAWILGVFGKGIARHFMVPYNTKFWTVSPHRMSCRWTEGFVPRPTLHQAAGRSARDRKELLGYNACFWYPGTGGVEALSLVLKERLAHVHTGFEARKIDLKKRQVVFVNGVKTDYTSLISTLPLPELFPMLSSMPTRVKAAFGRLRWNSVFNLNLGLKQKHPNEKHWIYFPQKDISFFRVGFYHNFSADLVPAGKSSLYAEVSYSKRKPIHKAGIVGRIERDLKKVGLLSKGDKILVRDINDIKYAYPVYDKAYAAARATILDFLRQHQILTCGRYGSWQYMSMEDAISDGIRVGKLLVDHG